MEDPITQGEVLAGKYRVEHVLGRGGMGVVVAATHLQLGQRVALKFLLPSACSSAEAVGRFLREARAAVQIHSEHVARVTDVGTLETGAPYMVMEFLRGADLGAVVHSRGPLPMIEAVDYVLQACEAIAEAHALGIVHRDLKPTNLFLTQRPDGSPLVKVLDFGISKALHDPLGAGSGNLTGTSAIMGSPHYMSPEQIRSSRDVDARSDIWALGIILHELLAVTSTFQAETVPALLAMIVADPPTPVRSVRPDLPVELEAIILRCLEKDRTRRFGNVSELARALAPFGPRSARVHVERISRILGHGNAGTATAETGNTSQISGAGSHTAGAWSGTADATRRRQRIGLGAVAALVAIVGAIGVGLAVRTTVGTPATDSAAASPPPLPTTASSEHDPAAGLGTGAGSAAVGNAAPNGGTGIGNPATGANGTDGPQTGEPPMAPSAAPPGPAASPTGVAINPVGKGHPRPGTGVQPKGSKPPQSAPAKPPPAAPSPAHPKDLFDDTK